MRNLKRALSLTLASVMLLGMMVIGTSAASFPDVSAEDNTEAIEVLKALKILNGYEDGTFRPDQTVTRNEMAVIMASLLGVSLNSAVGSCPFDDVPAWAEPAVSACVAQGIVNGKGPGIYDGASTVTAIEAGAMMLRALGYTRVSADDDWTRPWARLANKIELFDGLTVSNNTPMTRNNVAQLALNALESTVVDVYYGAEIVGGDFTYSPQIQYSDLTTSTYDYTAVGGAFVVGSSNTLQLVEKLYKKDLVKATGAAVTDDLGRPSTRWSYKNKTVITAPKTPVAVFNAGTGAAAVAKELNGYKVSDGTNDYAINNATVRTFNTSYSIMNDTNVSMVSSTLAVSGETIAKAIADETANGKLVEVYVNDRSVVSAIVTVKYDLLKVGSVISNSTDTRYTFTGAGALAGSYLDYADETVDDQLVVHGAVAKDDYVTAYKENGVLQVYPTTKIVGTQSAYNNSGKSIVVSGTTYKVAAGVNNVLPTDSTVGGDFANGTKDANYYIDQYGFVVKTDAIASTDYVVIDAIAKNAFGGAQAVLVFPDATTKTVDVKSLKDESGSDVTLGTLNIDSASNATYQNIVCTYSVASDGKYELTAVTTASGNSDAVSTAVANGTTLSTKGNPTVGTATTNDGTVFVVKNASNKFKAYTGFKNVPTIVSGGATKYDWARSGSTGAASFVYINAGAGSTITDTSANSSYVYVVKNDVTLEATGSDRLWHHNKVVVDGQNTTMTTNNSSYATLIPGGLYKITEVTDKGYAATLVRQTGGLGTDVEFVETVSAPGVYSNAGKGVVTVGGTTYSYDSASVAYVIDKDGNARTANVGDLNLGDNQPNISTVYVKVKDNAKAGTNPIDVIYVAEK